MQGRARWRGRLPAFSLCPFREVKARVQMRRHCRGEAKGGRAVPPAESTAGRERRAAPPAINRLPGTGRATAHPAARAFITRGAPSPRSPGGRRARTLRRGWLGRRQDTPSVPAPLAPAAGPGARRMGRPAGERQGEEGGRGGPALQQLLPAYDSPVPAVPLGQSHKAQRGGREHRVPLLGPWGPSWAIPASALPSPPPALAQPGRRKREPRADTSSSFAAAAASAPPCLLLPPPRDPPCPQPGVEEAGAERRGSLPAPPHAPRKSAASPARWAPRPPRPSPRRPRAPARPGRALGSERAAVQVGALRSFHASGGIPAATRHQAHPCAPGPAKLESGSPRAFVLCSPRGGLPGWAGGVHCHLVAPLLERK